MDLAELATGQGQDACEEQDRDEKQVALLEARRHQRQHQGAKDQDERRMEPEASHGVPPSASSTKTRSCGEADAMLATPLTSTLPSPCSRAPTPSAISSSLRFTLSLYRRAAIGRKSGVGAWWKNHSAR